MTDDELLEAYREARATTQADAVYRGKDVPAKTCRYCGRPWNVWAGSKADGHSKCMVTERFKRELKTAYERDPTKTVAHFAALLGVTTSVLRSWISPRSSRQPSLP